MALIIQDLDALRILSELIGEELDRYQGEDLYLLSEASLIIFSRALIIGSIKIYLNE